MFLFPSHVSGGISFAAGPVTGWGNSQIRNGYTIVVVTPTLLAGGSQVRVTFKAPETADSGDNMSVNPAYIGIRASSGDDWDFETTPTQLFVASAGNWVVPEDGTTTTDWATLTTTTSDKLCISWYIDLGNPDHDILMGSGDETGWNAYDKVANEPATVDKASYTTVGTDLAYGVESVEVQ